MISILIFFVLSFMPRLESFTTHHFYRASYLPFEPRLEESWLSSVDLQVAAGSTKKSLNSCGVCSNLFALYGSEPNSCRNGFFELTEATFNLTQNLTYGFFMTGYVPVLHTRISTLKKPLPCPELFQCRTQVRKTALADSAFLFGFTKNYEGTIDLDYIDATVQTGVIIPSGKNFCVDTNFLFPLGYNKHFGIPLVIDASVGVCDWVTAGIHGDLFFFLSKEKNLFVPSAAACCPTHCICAKPGMLSSICGYIKADHFFLGASLILGASHVHQGRGHFNKNSAGSRAELLALNPWYQGWKMTTFHFLFEWDFTQEEAFFGPRLAIFANAITGGRRILKTNMVGVDFGLDLGWCF